MLVMMAVGLGVSAQTDTLRTVPADSDSHASKATDSDTGKATDSDSGKAADSDSIFAITPDSVYMAAVDSVINESKAVVPPTLTPTRPLAQ